MLNYYTVSINNRQFNIIEIKLNQVKSNRKQVLGRLLKPANPQLTNYMYNVVYRIIIIVIDFKTDMGRK